jgi:hypothetical protein
MLMTPKWTFAAQKHTFAAQKHLIIQHFSHHRNHRNHRNPLASKITPHAKKCVIKKTAQNPF